MEHYDETPDWNRYDSIKSVVDLGKLALSELRLYIVPERNYHERD